MYFRSLALLLILLPQCPSGLRFTNCEAMQFHPSYKTNSTIGHVSNLDIAGCGKGASNCVMKAGLSADIQIIFKLLKPVQESNTSFRGFFMNSWHPAPGMPEQLSCDDVRLPCPLEAERFYTFRHTAIVPNIEKMFGLSIPTSIEMKSDEEEMMFCVAFVMTIIA